MVAKVSVVMPSYNHAAYVGHAVRSVLQQSLHDLELIIIDDGSSDRSRAILAECAAGDQRVRLYMRSNKGAPATINEGVRLARGKWIGIINSDDAYAPHRLELMLQSLERSGATWGFSRAEFIGETGGSARPQDADWYRGIQAGIAAWPTVGFALLEYNVTLTSGNLLFHRDLFDAVGPFRELQLVHDWDFALRLLRISEPLFFDQELYFYRLHGANTIRSISQSTTDREVNFILRDFFLSLTAERPPNPSAPCPFVWPGFFEETIQRLSFQGRPHVVFMPSSQERSYLLTHGSKLWRRSQAQRGL